MATAVQVESIWNGLTDNSGQPLAAGKVYTYSAGTTTPVSLYTSSDKSTSATNPLILDGNGKAQVWADGRYKFVVKTAADVALYTLDNLLYGFDDTTVLLGGISTGSANAQTVSVPATVESYANGQRITFIAGYTNSGATTLQFNALAPISIVKGPTPSSLQAGDLLAGQLYSCTYYGGSFYLENCPTPADVQRSRFQILSGVSGTNTITAAASPALTGYEAGQVFRFKASAASNSAATLNINGQGAKAIQRYGVALVTGEIQANDMVEVVYDGTQFQLINATPAPLFVDRTNNRVGIGTTAPSDTFEVATTGFFPQYWSGYAASAGGPNLMIRKSRGTTTGSNVIVNNSDILGSLDFAGANGTTFTSAANIAALVDGTPGATNDMPGRLVFSTTSDGSGTPTERMRITSAGYVGIGTTTPNSLLTVGDGTGSKVMVVNGGNTGTAGGCAFTWQNGSNPIIAIGNYSGIYGGAYDASPTIYNGSGLSYKVGNMTAAVGTHFMKWNNATGNWTYDTSSARYKDNIENSSYGLTEVLAMRPVTFTYKAEPNRHDVGFIAEEMLDVIPEVVAKNTEGEPDAISYDRLTSVLCKAIQELNAKVESLEARVAALEA
jgi:hypothetical protein